MPAQRCITATSLAWRFAECSSSSNRESAIKSCTIFWKRSSTGRSPHSLGEMEAVTHPRFRKQIFGARGVLLNFLSKLIDEYSQILHLVAVIRAPHRLQQLRMGDRYVRMRHHVLQKIEFLRREPGFPISHDNPAQVEVDFDIVETDDLHVAR